MWNYFKNKVAQMNIWDIAVLKFYLVSIGLLVGAYFPIIVMRYRRLLLVIIGISFLFLMYGLFFRKMSN